MYEPLNYINLQSQLYLPIEYLPVCTLIFNKKGVLLGSNSLALNVIGHHKENESDDPTRSYHKNMKLFYKLVSELMVVGNFSDRVLKIKTPGNRQVLIKCSGAKLGDRLSEIFIFQFTNISSFHTIQQNNPATGEETGHKLLSEIINPESFRELPEFTLMTVMKMYPTLSHYEATCFGLIALGLTNSQIAHKLDKTINSIGVTICRILKKLNLKSRGNISLSYDQLMPGS